MSGAIEVFDKKPLAQAFDEEVPDYLTPPEAIAIIETARSVGSVRFKREDS
jgi:hypothetical protein